MVPEHVTFSTRLFSFFLFLLFGGPSKRKTERIIAKKKKNGTIFEFINVSLLLPYEFRFGRGVSFFYRTTLITGTKINTKTKKHTCSSININC